MLSTNSVLYTRTPRLMRLNIQNSSELDKDLQIITRFTLISDKIKKYII
jgi:hypothetical protein